VVGELYEVDGETLDALDKLERHPTFYTRDVLHVALSNSLPGSASVVESEAYFMRNFRRHLLTTETLLTEYRETPEHRYVFREDRPAGGIIDIKEETTSAFHSVY